MSSFTRTIAKPSPTDPSTLPPHNSTFASSDHPNFETRRSAEEPATASGAEPIGPGTRSGLGGLALVSSGCNDLDKLYGGGIPLGSLVIVFEDAWSPHADTLLKYFAAEGIACQQQVLSIAGSAAACGALCDWLPRKVDKAPAAKPEEIHAQQDAGQHELRIAWQYRRYIKKQPQQAWQGPATSSFRRSATSAAAPAAPKLASWAHNFDLTKQCDRATLDHSACGAEHISFAEMQDVRGICQRVQAFVRRVDAVAAGGSLGSVQSGVTAALPMFSPKSVGRVVLRSLGGADWSDCGAPGAPLSIVKTLVSIKALVRDSRCVAMVTVPASIYRGELQAKLQLMADIALSVQAVADDSEIVRLSTEPQSCCGLLRVVKFTIPGMLALPVTDPMLSLIRHRRTRLAIVPIEIDPDAEMAIAEAESQLAGSATSLLCARPDNKDVSF